MVIHLNYKTLLRLSSRQVADVIQVQMRSRPLVIKLVIMEGRMILSLSSELRLIRILLVNKKSYRKVRFA